MKLQGTTSLQGAGIQIKAYFDVDEKELGRALLSHVITLLEIDDPGCDYYTDGDKEIYMGDDVEHPLITEDPYLTCLVDSANFLLYGDFLIAERRPA